ncbi:MAG: leucyl/phenylalanyl-tRNA--protein transferase [Pseudomonadota bacterium]
MALLTHLEDGDDFPPTSQALHEPNGLLAAGGRLTAEALLRAYHRGIFPWYEAPQPILWWSPDPRSVLLPRELRVYRSMRRRLRRNEFTLSVDTAFEDVMRACAEPRDGQRGTWIDEHMLAAYGDLHQRGWARSIEVWREDTLVGGLYGVLLGRVFFGESMFSRESDASKVALIALTSVMGAVSHSIIDCQIESEHLNSLGARLIPRLDFERRLAHTRARPAISLAVPRSCGELV